MPSPFPSIPVIRECSRKKTQIGRMVSIDVDKLTLSLSRTLSGFLPAVFSTTFMLLRFPQVCGMYHPSQNMQSCLLFFENKICKVVTVIFVDVSLASVRVTLVISK